FESLFGPVSGVYATKAALERTSDAGLMHRGSPAEERRAQVLRHRNSMEGSPRKGVRWLHESLAVVPVQPEEIFVRESEYRFEIALPAQCIQKLQQRMFALPAHYVIHIASVQRCVGICGWEISSPSDRHLRTQTAYLATCLHGRCHLRTGHAGDTQH